MSDMGAEIEFGEHLLKEYAGKWVAVRGREVIASAVEGADLYAQLTDEAEPYRSFRVYEGDEPVKGAALRAAARVGLICMLRNDDIAALREIGSLNADDRARLAEACKALERLCQDVSS